jgi:hypothetical protein
LNELFLGLIAAAVIVMAIVQVGAIVFAARAARRVGDVVSRLQQDVSPIVANLHTITTEAARLTAAAAAQTERADRLMTDLTRRLDETAAALQESVLGPARDLVAMLQRLKEAFGVFGRAAPQRGPGPGEDEDPLFIG